MPGTPQPIAAARPQDSPARGKPANARPFRVRASEPPRPSTEAAASGLGMRIGIQEALPQQDARAGDSHANAGQPRDALGPVPGRPALSNSTQAPAPRGRNLPSRVHEPGRLSRCSRRKARSPAPFGVTRRFARKYPITLSDLGLVPQFGEANATRPAAPRRASTLAVPSATLVPSASTWTLGRPAFVFGQFGLALRGEVISPPPCFSAQSAGAPRAIRNLAHGHWPLIA
jgi:hypothetical protein